RRVPAHHVGQRPQETRVGGTAEAVERGKELGEPGREPETERALGGLDLRACARRAEGCDPTAALDLGLPVHQRAAETLAIRSFRAFTWRMSSRTLSGRPDFSTARLLRARRSPPKGQSLAKRTRSPPMRATARRTSRDSCQLVSTKTFSRRRATSRAT